KDTARCTVTNLEIDATGTEFEGPPRLDVLVDGKPVAQINVSGVMALLCTPETSEALPGTAFRSAAAAFA
ncbi:hypothetical protein, partial [Mesorhizobium sp. M4B.F.Ca.ET.211.01.1.1]|uniref:hypothetical protein n=1 Tax=Mesorhizobium sp. M4B.F.Ca.ET.211.01.1.1 TaxID=2563954 RepID=UPI001679E93E